MKSSPHLLYTQLASLWPIFSPVEDYEDEGEQIVRILDEAAGGRAKSMLHLGCGGGHNDYWLKRAFDITGVDLSESMLEQARSLNPEVEYFKGDMRSVDLGRRFDVVLMLDANMYLLDRTSLDAALRVAYAHLAPGGLFFTCVELTKESFQQDRVEYSTHSRGETTVTHIEYYDDPDPDDSEFQCAFVYMIREQGRLRIEHEIHRLGLFTEAEWIDAINQAGFDVDIIDSSVIPGELNNLLLLVGFQK